MRIYITNEGQGEAVTFILPGFTHEETLYVKKLIDDLCWVKFDGNVKGELVMWG